MGETVLYNRGKEKAALAAWDNRARAVRALGLHEEYVALDEGVEQIFTLEQKPPQAGDLVIEGAFHTTLRPELVSAREGIQFLDGRGQPVLGYSGAVARDALGREQAARLALDGSRVRITVPESWLREARYPLTVDPLIGDPILVGEAGYQEKPATAYNPDDDEWLIVWKDNRNGGQWDIHGQRVRSDGTLAGDNLAIAVNTSYQGAPAVAYNPVSGKYLATWHDDRVSGQWHLYGQQVSADGTLVGSEIAICTASYYQLNPAVTYQPATEEWLVVWHSQRPDYIRIYGQRIASSGALVGPAFAISQQDYSHRGPDVAANPEAGEYLAVWHVHTNDLNYSVRAQRVQADGTLLGDETIITSAGKDLTWPQVAYNANNDEYLVVWQDYRHGNWDIYGQRLSAAGASLGGNLALTTDDGDQIYPRLAWDPRGGYYLVVWEGTGIEGQMVWPDGTLYGEKLHLAPDGESPDVAYSSGSGTFLVSYGMSGSIYAQRYGILAADFEGAPLMGTAPLTVTFTDTSTGMVDSRLWSFGDGSTPLTASGITVTHAYTATGVYTMSLTASGPGGSDTLTRIGYITAYESHDTTPPTITDFGPWGFITDTLPTFRATISDGLGSGVEAEGITMTLDSLAVNFDYDAGSGVISYTASLTEELHTVVLEAEDRAGNRAEPVTWTVWVNVSATVGIVNPTEAYILESSGDPLTVTVEFPAGAVTQTVSAMYGRWEEEERN